MYALLDSFSVLSARRSLLFFLLRTNSNFICLGYTQQILGMAQKTAPRELQKQTATTLFKMLPSRSLKRVSSDAITNLSQHVSWLLHSQLCSFYCTRRDIIFVLLISRRSAANISLLLALLTFAATLSEATLALLREDCYKESARWLKTVIGDLRLNACW